MNIRTGSGFHIELVGMPALNAKLARIGEAWEQAADDATREIAEFILSLADARVHVLSGDLKASGHVERLARHQYAVVYDTPYARIEEFRVGGRAHSGAHAYLRPAYDEGRAMAMERTADLIQRATRSVAA